MEEKFKESQTSLTNLEINLKEIKSVFKKFSQNFTNISKTVFSLPTAGGLTPTKEHGVPYFAKKLVDFIKNTQETLANYGLKMKEHIDEIEELLSKISKTKKNHNFIFDSCKKRLNGTHSELEDIKKMHSSKIKAKTNVDFNLNFDKNMSFQSQNTICEIKGKVLNNQLEDFQRKEAALWESLKSASSLIHKEVADCLKESVQLEKHVINCLNTSFQQLNEKNFYLYKDLRKINDKYLGIEKLGQISLVISNNLDSKIIQKDNFAKKPPLNLSNLTPSESQQKESTKCNSKETLNENMNLFKSPSPGLQCKKLLQKNRYSNNNFDSLTKAKDLAEIKQEQIAGELLESKLSKLKSHSIKRYSSCPKSHKNERSLLMIKTPENKNSSHKLKKENNESKRKEGILSKIARNKKSDSRSSSMNLSRKNFISQNEDTSFVKSIFDDRNKKIEDFNEIFSLNDFRDQKINDYEHCSLLKSQKNAKKK